MHVMHNKLCNNPLIIWECYKLKDDQRIIQLMKNPNKADEKQSRLIDVIDDYRDLKFYAFGGVEIVGGDSGEV